MTPIVCNLDPTNNLLELSRREKPIGNVRFNKGEVEITFLKYAIPTLTFFDVHTIEECWNQMQEMRNE